MNNNNLDNNVDRSWDNSKVDPREALADEQASSPKPSFVNEELIDPFEEAKKKAQKTIPAPEPEPVIQEKKETVTETVLPPKQETIANKPEPELTNLPKPTIPPPISNIENIQPTKEIPKITEEENKTEKPPVPIWKTVLKILAIFVGITLFIYFFINFSAYMEKINYLINPPKYETVVVESVTKNKDIAVTSTEDIFTAFLSNAFNQPIKYTEVKNTEPTQQPSQSPGNNTENNSESTSSGDIANNTLIIPKLGKWVPIVWNSPPDENVMLENLQNGVVHYAGTPLPGEGKGPIFISGHSSYYSWDPGKYKTVFTNLDKLSEGDIIQIKYNDRIFTYQVYETVTVNPDQVDVLNATSEPTLDLMTCVPVGTNQQRLIVKARQI